MSIILVSIPVVSVFLFGTVWYRYRRRGNKCVVNSSIIELSKNRLCFMFAHFSRYIPKNLISNTFTFFAISPSSSIESL